MNRIPFDLTIDCRRAHRDRLLKRQIAWVAILLAVMILCVSLGVLVASAQSALLSVLAGLVVLGGVKGAHYLLTRH